MTAAFPFRQQGLRTTLSGAACALAAFAYACPSLTYGQRHAGPPPRQAARPAPVPILRRPPPPPPPMQHQATAAPQQPVSQLAPIQRRENPGEKGQGEHLAGWMDHHANLTTTQQQQALEKEPGFHDLPPQTQQRMRDRLTQLNNMTPEQRAKIIGRTETLEKLTPDQRAQVRSSIVQMAQLPADRRRAVRQSFMGLRELPPAQRQAYLNSPDAHARFSDIERSTLSGLISAEPYPPIHE